MYPDAVRRNQQRAQFLSKAASTLQGSASTVAAQLNAQSIKLLDPNESFSSQGTICVACGHARETTGSGNLSDNVVLKCMHCGTELPRMAAIASEQQSADAGSIPPASTDKGASSNFDPSDPTTTQQSEALVTSRPDAAGNAKRQKSRKQAGLQAMLAKAKDNSTPAKFDFADFLKTT